VGGSVSGIEGARGTAARQGRRLGRKRSVGGVGGVVGIGGRDRAAAEGDGGPRSDTWRRPRQVTHDPSRVRVVQNKSHDSITNR
jgi:uncharacterized protein YraI